MTLPFIRDEAFRALEAAGRASVGEYTYGAPTIAWWGEDTSITLGRYCSIADGVTLFAGGNHRHDWITTYPFTELEGWPGRDVHPGHPASKGPIRIGHDVWLGNGAAIMSGVTIGSGAVVAARAVVARDVPPYAIVAGNPARAVRHRFDQRTVERLLELKWWDLPQEAVRRLLPLMLCDDVPAFLAALERERGVSSVRKRGMLSAWKTR